MYQELLKLVEAVTDERSFNTFLSALREDCEKEQECRGSYYECAQEGHWETRETRHFLRSVEDWATGGDFAEGRHYGDPILRRVATMLLVGRHLLSEDRPPR